MASGGTCTLLNEMSVARPGLLWSGGRLGERKWKSGLPGAEPRSWALAWDNAGEPGTECWRREGEEGQLCLGTRAGAAAGNLKLLPLAVISQDKLERFYTMDHRQQQSHGDSLHLSEYLLWSDKPIRSCRFWEAAAAAVGAGSAVGPEPAVLPKISAPEAGA